MITRLSDLPLDRYNDPDSPYYDTDLYDPAIYTSYDLPKFTPQTPPLYYPDPSSAIQFTCLVGNSQSPLLCTYDHTSITYTPYDHTYTDYRLSQYTTDTMPPTRVVTYPDMPVTQANAFLQHYDYNQNNWETIRALPRSPYSPDIIASEYYDSFPLYESTELHSPQSAIFHYVLANNGMLFRYPNFIDHSALDNKQDTWLTYGDGSPNIIDKQINSSYAMYQHFSYNPYFQQRETLYYEAWRSRNFYYPSHPRSISQLASYNFRHMKLYASMSYPRVRLILFGTLASIYLASFLTISSGVTLSKISKITTLKYPILHF